ncbi:ATP-binding protein [Tumebacillus sp. BK434]|uniref:ATP-binding protein n=1 Tax=Tumebacillus sp. BK434 TaxID=2512169 RepID=UPI001404F9D4|nr:ATP-binding protein [Tumebacillus sp. BK434]
MVESILKIFWKDLGAYLHEDEYFTYSQHIRELVGYVDEIIATGERNEGAWEPFFEYGRAYGHRLATRGLQLEIMLEMGNMFRESILNHVFHNHQLKLHEQDAFGKILYISAKINTYMNKIVLGFHRAEQEVAEQAIAARSHQVLNHLPFSIVVYDKEGRLQFANSVALDPTGLSYDQVIGKTRSELKQMFSRSSEPENIWRKVMNGERIRWRANVPSKVNDLEQVDKEMIPLFDETGEVDGSMTILYSPVTEKERLYNLHKQFSFVLNSMNSGLLILNQDFSLTAYNKKAEEIFGLAAEQVLGTSLLDLYNRYTGKDMSESKLNSAMKRGLPIRDLEYKIEINGRSLTIRIDGNPIKNTQGQPVGYILIIDDQTELLAMREAMMRNEKFALIGQFAAGIAHEIRNPLTTVFGFLQLFASKSVQPDNFHDLTVKLLIPELDRANTILSDFLMVSRPQAPQRQSVCTETFLADVLRLVESEANLRGVMLEVEVPDDLPRLNLDVQQMKQVFLNLCKNAFDVTPPGGTLMLRVKVENQAVVFEVIDEGPGILAEDLSHIFEPFYTTKEHGTGLGLPISHRIIEGHGGMLTVRSTEGVGTTFAIGIPFAQ